jgi:8-oxo-dGTP pyrophosphatase MutT (NUDIX family)
MVIVRVEKSAGGVVFFGNTVLLLMKMNGDWVLPKGRIEENETEPETALREVHEETGVKADILEYVGEIHYAYKNYWTENQLVDKTVFWYLMTTKSMRCVPQREEGFKAARFIHMNKASKVVKYDDERNIIDKAINAYKAKYYQNDL